MIPEWVNEYIGIPFAARGRDRSGCDCWGLFRLVKAERDGIALGKFLEYDDVCDPAIPSLLAANLDGRWLKIPQGQEREGDGLLIRFLGEPMHVGMVVSPGYMLHAVKGTDSCIESYYSPKWISRIEGIYRYAE